MPLVIPQQSAPPTEHNPRIMILYGPPKVGKTELFNQSASVYFSGRIDNPLHIDLESGTDYIQSRRLSITTWDQYRELHSVLTPKKERYIVFDTIDKLEELCEARATTNYKQSIIGKNFTGPSVLALPDGAGYRWLREAFQQMINMASEMAKYVIFIGHIRDKNLTNGQGAVSVIAKDLDLTGKIRNIACARADAIGYVYRDVSSKLLCVNFITIDGVNCGSRCIHLRGVDLKPFDWGKIYVN